jgi:hypothetical protein
MLLWHYDVQPALFTVPVWRAVGALVRDASVVVISEGSDQPALETLVLALCAFHGAQLPARFVGTVLYSPVVPPNCWVAQLIV